MNEHTMRALPADPPATSLARLKEASRCAAGALSCGAVAPLFPLTRAP